MLAELDRIRDSAEDRYFDVFDLHWSGQFAGDDDYDVINLPSGTYGLLPFLADIRTGLDNIGYGTVPLYITEMSDYSDSPEGYTAHTEAYHAAAVIKRYVYALAAGVEKIFWAQAYESHDAGGIVNGYFDNVGLVNNPENADGYSHRKLAYYSYKKMAEMLKDCDWKTIRAEQDSDNVRVYRFTKNGGSVYTAWWDYLRDPGYTPGMTKQTILADLQGTSFRITEAVPFQSSGANVESYSTAFTVTLLPVKNNSATITLNTNPVYVEVLR